MPLQESQVYFDGPWVVVRLRIPYADTDRMEHVYYANYLVYFEIARTEWMRALGLTYRSFEELGYGVPVAESHVRYKGRIFYDDLVEIRAAASIVGKTRFRFDYQLRRAGEEKVLADGYTTHAVLDMGTGKVCRIPRQLIELAGKLPPRE